MKEFIRTIIIFILGSLVFICIPIHLLSEYDNIDKNTSLNHNIIRLQTKSYYDSLDILFVGNSYCYSSMNTEYMDSLNIRSFNLGIATAGVQFYDLILNDYFKNTLSPPKTVLLLVSPMTFSSQSDNFTAYPIHRYLENEKSNFEICIKFNRLDELISMYRRSTKKGLSNILFKKEVNYKNKHSNNKGFLPNSLVVTSEIISNDEILYLSLKEDLFIESKVEDLLQIANSIKKKGSEVVFFELPTNLLYKYFSINYLNDYKKSLVTISDNYELISIDQDLFSSKNYRNIDHMNSSGAKIATKQVMKLLE